MNADQPKQEAKATACPKCGGGMLECGIETSNAVQLAGSLEVPLVPLGKGVFNRRRSGIRALMCERCGYVELYGDPTQIKSG